MTGRPFAAAPHRIPLRILLLAALLLLLLLQPACRSQRPARPGPPPRPGATERGIASWYGEPFHGRRTANGEVYDMHLMTAAHKTLPFQTLVEVVNLDNGRRTRVRINDRGPFIRGRIIDLSFAAAREIGMIGPGTARVEVRILGSAEGPVELAREPAPAAYGYTVQVGAFRERDRAEELVRELRRVFPDVVIRRQDGWHRVQVGEFADRARAEPTRLALADLDLPAVVVGIR